MHCIMGEREQASKYANLPAVAQKAVVARTREAVQKWEDGLCKQQKTHPQESALMHAR